MIVVVLAWGLVPDAAFAATVAKTNDYTGDHLSDILVQGGINDCLAVMAQTGRDSFSAPQATGQCADFFVNLATVGDINGDGIGDLVGVLGGCLYRFLGTGSGHFGAYTRLGCGWDNYTTLAGAGDLDGDGIGDLVGINSSTGCLWRWLGNGNGGFRPGVQLGCGWTPYTDRITGVGDLNGDGIADLVGINAYDGYLYRWLGDGHGGYGAGTRLGPGWGRYTITGLGDTSGDGIGDLVGVDQVGLMYLWTGNGRGSFSSGVEIGAEPGTYLLTGA